MIKLLVRKKEVTEMTNLMRLLPRTERFFSLIPEMDIMGRFFDDLELPQIFRTEGDVLPAFDVAETEKEYTITGEIPGIEAKDLDVTLADGTLTIQGEKKREQEEKGEHFHRIEREYGSFHRGFRVPENVKTEELQAHYKDGVLKITLPKAEIKTKKIEVKEEKAAEKKETHVEVE
jgi:HSP20 family protein